MLYYLTSVSVSSTIYYTGFLYRWNSTTSTLTTLTLPVGVKGTNARPCAMAYRGSLYILGGFSSNITITPSGKVCRMGLYAPSLQPTIAGSGAQPGSGLTGTAIGYVSIVHKENGRVVHESNLSMASESVDLSGQDVTWAVLESIGVDFPQVTSGGRATHIRLYLSLDGALPRLVGERVAGVAGTVTSTTAALLSAGETPATTVDSTGAAIVDAAARSIPPNATVGVIFHDRAWYISPGKAGVYFSRAEEPESVDPDDFIPTPAGDQPTGLCVTDDTLLVFTKYRTYGVTGFGEDDFSIRLLSDSYGSLNHHGIIVVQGMVMFPSLQGISVFQGGTFRNLMGRTLRTEWKTRYAANTAEFERIIAVDDKSGHARWVLSNLSDEGSNDHWAYVAYYAPMTEEGALEPHWLEDVRSREETAVGMMSTDGITPPVVVYGGEDGFIRKEDATNSNDDSDANSKTMVITHKHIYPEGDQGGDVAHGYTYTDLQWYGVNTTTDVSIVLFTGEDDAVPGAFSQNPYSKTFEAVSISVGPKVTSRRAIVAGAAGRGATPELRATAPVDVEHRGIGFSYHVGPHRREQGA